MVGLPEERRWLDSLPEEVRGRSARLIFSAKECAYKLQYRADPQDVWISVMYVSISMWITDVFRRWISAPAGTLSGAKASYAGRWGRNAGL